MNQNVKTLLLLPSVGIWRIEGDLFFDRKFYDGLCKYASIWGGQLRVCMTVANTQPPKFGLVKHDDQHAPALIELLGINQKITTKHLQGVDVVLASADNYSMLGISELCQQMKIACVYSIEYILETRLQILWLEYGFGMQFIKSALWTLGTELKRRIALQKATGLQANGVPAYEAYSALVKKPMLYFDTRIEHNMLISDQQLDQRLSVLDKLQPLRLAFSGRLIKMKGADHLLEMALLLRKRQIPFQLDIFGDGDLFDELSARIKQETLSNQVYLHGAVDFKNTLIPYIKNNVDLFVVCHRQSDPSCTYLETYACGVPILGYANKAHAGILTKYDVGWQVPMNDVRALVAQISDLHVNRNVLKAKSKSAMLLAKQNDFDQTFRRRMLHCLNAVH